jgi:hypothetical protein
VTASRTSWTSLANNTICGSGCLFGVCQFGGCAILGAGSCGSTDCGVGYCDPGTGQCQFTPTNAGGACSQIGTNGCTSTQGTCDAFGHCVRPANTGQACFPGSAQTDLCYSTTSGTCDASGQCVPQAKPSGTDCRPASGSDPCATYTCEDLLGSFTCVKRTVSDLSNVCPTGPQCNPQMCDPVTGACYASPPDLAGQRLCTTTSQCCRGQTCACPPDGGQFCVAKYCYGIVF